MIGAGRAVNVLWVGQPPYDLFGHCISPRGDLLWRLVLDGMRNVDGVEAGASQGASLDARGRHKLRGRHRHCRNAQIL
jgi:hypothetical protein